MQLYMAKRAPNPRRIELFLAAHQTSAKALNIEEIYLDLATSDNKQASFLEINPFGALPVLRLDDGHIISESVAICRYLEEVSLQDKSDIKLFGRTPIERVIVEQMNRTAEFEVLVPMTYAFQMQHPFWVGKKQQCPEFSPIAQARVLTAYKHLNQYLSKNKFLANQQLSIADLTLYSALDFARLAKPKVDETYPHLLAYYQRLHAMFATV